MCSPSPPPAPDYKGAAAAQGQANVEAAQATSRLSNPNLITPYGTQTYQEGASPSDRPTMTQQFSPEQQALYDQSTRVKKLLGGLGEQGAAGLEGIVGRPLDLSGVPQAPGSAEATREKVINAMMGRVDTDIAQQRDNKASQLIAAGIRPGTEAYDREMTRFDRQRTDALQQAQLAGGQEASRDFGLDSERRRQAISEMLSQRQVPLNEITALMSGSQVQNPFSTPGYTGSQVAPAPVYGATQASGQYGTDVYNADVGSQNAMMQGLFGLGSAALPIFALGASDRRLKSNIHRIATHPLGIGIYEYDIFDRHEIGVMAQELLEVKPEAVFIHPEGYMMVDYGQL